MSLPELIQLCVLADPRRATRHLAEARTKVKVPIPPVERSRANLGRNMGLFEKLIFGVK